MSSFCAARTFDGQGVEKQHSPVVIPLQHAHPARPAVVTARRPRQPTPIASTRPWRGVVVVRRGRIPIVVVVFFLGPSHRRHELFVTRASIPFRARVQSGTQEAATPEPPPPPRDDDPSFVVVVVAAAAPVSTNGLTTNSGVERPLAVVVCDDEARAKERARRVPAQHVRDDEDYERRVRDVPAAPRRRGRVRRTMGIRDVVVVFVVFASVAIVVGGGGAPAPEYDRPPERREVRVCASQRHRHAKERSATVGCVGGGGRHNNIIMPRAKKK
jgi:hypothetical protein